jgi:hypothetical protein
MPRHCLANLAAALPVQLKMAMTVGVGMADSDPGHHSAASATKASAGAEPGAQTAGAIR